MADDYYDQIVAILRRHGRVLVRTGRDATRHSPVNDRTFAVPASKSRHTANEVLKQAGLAERIR